jgi:DNA ligase 1
MLYSKLAQLYEDLSSTTKRLEKTDILAKFLSVLPEEEEDVLYLLLGNIYAQYDSRKIGISEQLVVKSIARASGASSEEVVKKWKKLGDLGKVSEELVGNKKQSTLSSSVLKVDKVLLNLRKLPELVGIGTIDRKMSLIMELLTSASGIEAKYLVRTLIGDLRVGVHESTVRDAMAVAFFDEEEKKENAIKIQEALDKSNDLVVVYNIVKDGQIDKLEKISLVIGQPVKVMLAQKVSTIEEAFEKVGKPAVFEYKYDGFRLIIHKDKSGIKLFTRRLENVTKQFPEVVGYVEKYIEGKEFILDSEAIGFDSKTREYKPFQDISQRIRRKYHIEEIQKKLPVEVDVFDILYYEGRNFIKETFEKRTELVKKIVKNVPYKIMAAKQLISSDVEEAEKFYAQALDDNQEGVMIKSLTAPYKPGSRVGHMIKLKPNERDYDLVITGAEYGKGKRQGWLSSFILSAYDEETGKYVEVGKASTGLKEKSELGLSFDDLTKLIKPLILKETGRQVEVKPKIVVAITYQEIQKSPNYNSGYALRFPRFTALREDKPLSEIASLEDLEVDYKNQSSGK